MPRGVHFLVRFARFWLLLALTLSSAAALAQHAKTALTMANRARAEYEAGKFEHAATLYAEAARLDPATHDYTYAAGRAWQKAGNPDRAAEAYRTYLTIAVKDPEELRQKARGFLAEMQEMQADRLAKEADTHFSQGDFTLAAQRYAEAANLAPSRLGIVLRAGLAAEKTSDRAAAVPWYEQWLAAAPQSAPERGDVKQRLARLRGEPVPAVKEAVIPRPQPKDQSPEVVQPPRESPVIVRPPARTQVAPRPAPMPEPEAPEPSATRKTLGIAGSTVGGGLLVIGVILLVMAQNQDSALENSIYAGKQPTAAERDSVNSLKAGGAVCAGAGVVLGGLGLYALLN